MDLPTTLETAEMSPTPVPSGAQPVHRVKSMFQQVSPVRPRPPLTNAQQSTGKLTPPRLPAHPPPPQRSISHSEVS